jgi:hypothetical protein
MDPFNAALILATAAMVVVGVVCWFLDRDVERIVWRTIDEYEKDEHRCGICWFHKMGVRHGHARTDDPIPHWCWEQGRQVGDDD